MIKGNLLLSSYEQLWVVEYGEIGRWSLVGVKVCYPRTSPNIIHRFFINIFEWLQVMFSTMHSVCLFLFLCVCFQWCAYGLTWSADLNDCVKCSCNGHSDHCDPLNGTCFVSTVVVTKRERNHVTTDNYFKSIFSTGGYSYLEPRTPPTFVLPSSACAQNDRDKLRYLLKRKAPKRDSTTTQNFVQVALELFLLLLLMWYFLKRKVPKQDSTKTQNFVYVSLFCCCYWYDISSKEKCLNRTRPKPRISCKLLLSFLMLL